MAEKKSTKKKAAVTKTAKKRVSKKTVKVSAGATATAVEKIEPTERLERQLTTVIARVDIGWGNQLYIRGEGGGLSWERGQLMDWSNDAWSWSSSNASGEVTFKFALNDQHWSEGENLTVPSGGTSISTPVF